MKPSPAKKIALTGVLFALALVLSLLESFLTPVLGLYPGIKIGLANIVVLYALLFLTPWHAGMLVLLKAGFALLVRGVIAGALSLAGGGFSFAVMCFLLFVPRNSPSVVLVSVAGALAHNIGQMVVFSAMFGMFAWAYAPVLIISGIVMGSLTAFTLRVLLPALSKAGMVGKERIRLPEERDSKKNK